MSYTTREQIARIVEMRLEGDTLQEIGYHYGLSRERIRQILAAEGITGKVWRGYEAIHYRRLAHAVSVAARKAVATAQLGDEHFPHGTPSGYMRGCPCDRCRTSNRERGYRSRGYTPKTRRPHTEGSRTDGSQRAANYHLRRRQHGNA